MIGVRWSATMDDFRHYTNDPKFTIDGREYGPRDLVRPEGLWLSIKDSWLRWCHDRGMVKNKLAYWYPMAIDPDASILRIDSNGDLFALAKTYGYRRVSEKLWVDWSRLSREYQGIVITLPCEPERCRDNPRTHWYVPWSCPSGCVWDTTVLTIVGGASRMIPRRR